MEKDYFLITDENRTIVNIIERSGSTSLRELVTYMCETGLKTVFFSKSKINTEFSYPDRKAHLIYSGIDKATKSIKVDLKINDNYFSTYYIKFEIACNIM